MMQRTLGVLIQVWGSYLDEQEDSLHSEQAQKKDDVQSQAIVISRQAHPHQLHHHTLLVSKTLWRQQPLPSAAQTQFSGQQDPITSTQHN